MTRAIIWMLLASCTSVVDFQIPRETGEQCGDAIDNDGNGSIDCADPTCATFPACLETCGNGTLDSGEQCDDNNRLPDDGCGPDCTIDDGCGNGIVEGSEECDDENDDDTDGCLQTCRIAVCGDGFVQAGVDDCDDGNLDDTDSCSTSCETASCGDGLVQAGVEQCDDANPDTNDGCASCVIERCGDNITQTGPAVTQLDFEWLASTCVEPAGDITVTINGVVVLETIGDLGSCNCAPGGGSQILSTTESQFLGLIVDGPNTIEVDYSGAGQFLGWAMLTVHTGAKTTEIVVHEGAPGAAKARVDSLCGGGFDENVPAKSAIQAVSVLEECDDGNTVDDDACSNTCRLPPPPTICDIPAGAILAWSLDIPLASNFDTQQDITYKADNRLDIAAAGTPFSRIAYCLELDDTFVYAEMDDFTSGDPLNTGIPTEAIFDTTLSNLTVRTNVAGLAEVTNGAEGRIELWGHCYNTAPDSLFDTDDTLDSFGPDCFGSFQIHRDATTTALAYNAWSSDEPDAVGIGNQPAGHPDWTFAQNTSAFTARSLRAFLLP